MNDVTLVAVLKAGQNLPQKRIQHSLWHPRSAMVGQLSHVLAQIAVQKLEDKVVCAIVGEDVEHLDHVRVRQLAEHRALAQDSNGHALVIWIRWIRDQDRLLDRHLVVRVGVLPFETKVMNQTGKWGPVSEVMVS